MKQLIHQDIGTYTLAPGSNQVTIYGVPGLSPENILIINDQTANIIIYNFAVPTLGYNSFVQNADQSYTITLSYGCSALNAADILLIYVDIPFSQSFYPDPGTPWPIGGDTPSGIQRKIRIGERGEICINEAHSRYYETCLRKNLFGIMSASTLSIRTSATTGLILYNGLTNVNLVIQKISFALVAASSSTNGIMLCVAPQPSPPTSISTSGLYSSGPSSLFIGGPPSQAQAFSAATLGAQPAAVIWLATNAGSSLPNGLSMSGFDLEGSIILPPNSIMCFAAGSSASATNGFIGSVFWEEISFI